MSKDKGTIMRRNISRRYKACLLEVGSFLRPFFKILEGVM
jgi:hypothetical protein